MAFQVDAGVRPRKVNDTTSREMIYYKPVDGKKVVFTCVMGRYLFTNTISATVFAYLNSRVGPAAATEAVVRMEQKLDKVGARWADQAPSALGLVEALTPVGRYLQVGEKISGAFGKAFMDQQLSNKDWGEYDPYEPKAAYRWSGSGADEYVDYALAWWGLSAKNGPAYKLLRDKPGLKKH